MDQNIQKALWLAVSVLLFVAVISVGMLIFSRGMELVEESEKSTTEVTNKLRDIPLDKYNGKEVTGDQVIAAIKEFSNRTEEFMIEVETNTGQEYQYISEGDINGYAVEFDSDSYKDKDEMNNDLKNAKDPTHSNYINPSGKFESMLIYDENEVVRGILFEQQ